MSLNLSVGANLSTAMRMDSSDGGSGPVPRWQRKARETGLTIKPPNTNFESSFINRSGLCVTPHDKTPLTASLIDTGPKFTKFNSKSPSRAVVENIKRGKSPHKSITVALRNTKTPQRPAPNALGERPYVGDRFIPRRPTDKEHEMASHLVLKHLRKMEGTEEEEELTQQQQEFKDAMLQNLNDGKPLDTKIVHFHARAPMDQTNKNKILHSATKDSVKKNSTRHIPTAPERVLDAPELRDDYYLHLLDWSSQNHIAVALASTVYVWNATDGTTTSLSDVEDPDYICSLQWMKDGNILAVGLSTGDIQLWDVNTEKLVRTMQGHETRVSTLKWINATLTSGSRSGQIIHSDARQQEHIQTVINAHNQEICGLSYSSDGKFLGSGGNDNIVKIYDRRANTHLYRMTGHEAAIKAVAWCPWQSHVLATGGGTADKTIRLWSAHTGTCTKEIVTDSQVSSIVFNPEYKELISGHGYSRNQLTIWKYPNFNKVTELLGHTGRVLDIVPSPDGELVASSAGDETIRLWKVWQIQERMKKKSTGPHKISTLNYQIR